MLAAVLMFAGGCGTGQAPSAPDSAGSAGTETESTGPEAGTAGQEEAAAAGTEEVQAVSAGRSGEADEMRIRQQAGTKLQSMTLEQKVAQMFVVTPDALTGVEGTTICGEVTKDALARLPVGGLVYMQENLQNADQTRYMLLMTQEYSREITGLPMLLFTEEEGGSASRISGNEGFPEVPPVSSMAVIGSSGDPQQAGRTGETIGEYLAGLGFNADLAPAADVLSNPENQVMGSRSFGSDPETAASLAAAMGAGLESEGVLACYKHFPGSGAAAGDVHDGYAYTNKTLEQLRACELLPFQKAVDEGARMIMAAHISLPNVIGYSTPASLSPYMLKNILRQELGFEGVIITDAMNLAAVTDLYSSSEAAVMAVQAGADMILMPEDLWSAYTAVIHAVRDGQITEEQIDSAVGRILRIKYGFLSS